MGELLAGRTVIAIDLPGLGDSTGQVASYDMVRLARYVHILRHPISTVSCDPSAVPHRVPRAWPFKPVVG